ncbi:VOC family protein [Gordonia sp. MP11Mi]|uniref:Glyoxalase n=1 Tax=Gordonia sp. MP11Mi TaxID=3022769 RepID=A0AA97CWZ7_9ACTN
MLRLGSEGVDILTPIETGPWGERYFQMVDANGFVYHLVQWVESADGASSSARQVSCGDEM